MRSIFCKSLHSTEHHVDVVIREAIVAKVKLLVVSRDSRLFRYVKVSCSE